MPSKFTALEMSFLDKALKMESGYVLDFSDRTISHFFADELGIDINDPLYGQASKARRLREFLRVSDPALAARALRKLWDYYETKCADNGEPVPLNFRNRILQIASRLEGDAELAKTDAIERFAPDETLAELVSAIERDVQARKPQAALDRLHTYCMKKFAHLLRKRGEDVKESEPLNSRAGRYLNPYRREGKFRPISDSIMKSTIEVFALFNAIRNKESLAHDNETVVQPDEARFIFEAVVNMLRFLKSIEGSGFGP